MAYSQQYNTKQHRKYYKQRVGPNKVERLVEKLRDISELDFAYVAGLADGEAYVGVQQLHNNYVTLTIQICQKKTTVLYWLQEMFGGYINDTNKPPIQGWTLRGYCAVELLQRIRPYMKVKHTDVDEALQCFKEKKPTVTVRKRL